MAAADWPKVRTFLIGRCGKTERECYNVTTTELEALAEGRRQEHRERMEHERWKLYMEARLFGHFKKTPEDPTEICRFEWEDKPEEAEVYVPTEEDAARLTEIFRQLS